MIFSIPNAAVTKSKDLVWIEGDGVSKVVKVGATLVSSLKKEVCNSFVASLCHLNVTDSDILNWLSLEIGIQAEVKRLNSYRFWIKPVSHREFFEIGRN